MKQGTIILLCGLPGAGKTTLAKELEINRDAIRFCPDDWISRLLKDQNDVPEMDRLRDPVEQLQWESAQRLCQLGVTIILENGFWSVSERNAYRDIAHKLGAKIELHFLNISLVKLWERLQQRNMNLKPGTFAVNLDELKEWDKIFERPDMSELETYDSYEVYD